MESPLIPAPGGFPEGVEFECEKFGDHAYVRIADVVAFLETGKEFSGENYHTVFNVLISMMTNLKKQAEVVL